jgi:leader peptidase (prepilin peptidase)/N-methyltransferase
LLLPVTAVFGLLIGSFLNVVIVRVPAGESVVRPGSRCPVCAVPIAARDNIPVVSWVLLRGRARCCGARVGLRYPSVELATALALVGVAAWTGPSWRLPAFAYLAALSIALAMIDVDTQRLPFWLVAPSYPVAAVLLGIAWLGERDGASAVRAAVGAALLWGFYRVLHLVYPAGMGYGDVRLAGLLGLYLSWLGWDELVVGAFLGFLVGGLGGVVQIALRKVSLKSSIPYGPYMLLGAWLGILLGQPIAGWYLRTAGLA